MEGFIVSGIYRIVETALASLTGTTNGKLKPSFLSIPIIMCEFFYIVLVFQNLVSLSPFENKPLF